MSEGAIREKSIIKNCYIKTRNDEILLEQHADGSATLNLDGYAIVPLEDLPCLKKLGEESKVDRETLNEKFNCITKNCGCNHSNLEFNSEF